MQHDTRAYSGELPQILIDVLDDAIEGLGLGLVVTAVERAIRRQAARAAVDNDMDTAHAVERWADELAELDKRWEAEADPETAPRLLESYCP